VRAEFGPPRKSYHTEYPFWYLRNDGLWEVEGADAAKVREGKADQPTKSELLRVGASGGLVPDAHELLRSDPRLLHEISALLVDTHFPDSVRDDVLSAVGLDDLEVVRRRKRDPVFREAVLVGYGYRCAVCDFDARLGHAPLAIEAAHVQWHQAGGPDRVENGLSLCSLLRRDQRSEVVRRGANEAQLVEDLEDLGGRRSTGADDLDAEHTAVGTVVCDQLGADLLRPNALFPRLATEVDIGRERLSPSIGHLDRNRFHGLTLSDTQRIIWSRFRGALPFHCLALSCRTA